MLSIFFFFFIILFQFRILDFQIFFRALFAIIIEAQAETEETKAQGAKAKSTSGRLTLGEETKARKLKQTALKFFQYRYWLTTVKWTKTFTISY